MPVFRVEDWPHGPLEVYSLTVLAVMIYPHDEQLSAELRATFIAELAFRQEAQWGRPIPETLWRLLASRHVGRAAQEILAAAEQITTRQGFLSGELVLLIYDLIHDRMPGSFQGGVLQACDMLSQAAKSNHRTIIDTPIPRRTPRWFHDQVWRRYRSVAHLWLAHMILSKQNASVWTPRGWYQPGSHLFGDPQSFVLFLSVAEYYRQWLTSYRPHALRGQPLLRAEESWSPPPEIVLHPVEIHETVPLPAAYQLARKNYRAHRSRHRH